MNGRLLWSSVLVCLVAVVTASVLRGQPQERPVNSTTRSSGYDRQIQEYAARMLKEGPANLSLRYFRLGGFLGRKAPAA